MTQQCLVWWKLAGEGDHLENAGICCKFLQIFFGKGLFGEDQVRNINKHLPFLSATDRCSSSVLEEMGSDTKDPI